MKHFSIMLCSFLFLQGCATLSKDECATANWLSIGIEDGTKGYGRDRINEHSQACADYGITPDLKAYQQGYDQGLLLFCTPRNGFAMGRNGYEYTSICPLEAERGFLQGYDGGREIYSARARSSKINSDLQAIANRLQNVQYNIHHYEGILYNDTLGREERRDLRRTIRHLRDEQDELLRQYNLLQDEKNHVDHRLDFLHRRYSDYE